MPKPTAIALCDNKELISPAEWDAWQECKKENHASENHRGHEQGTVGAVAIDPSGALFAATSTGGTCCKLPGRIGDSPLIGCGCYADSEAGGVSATGLRRSDYEGSDGESGGRFAASVAVSGGCSGEDGKRRFPFWDCQRRSYAGDARRPSCHNQFREANASYSGIDPSRSRGRPGICFQHSAHGVWLCGCRR